MSPHTYDHRVWKTGLPVRSAVLKPHAGRLVVGWVTTSESLLLYVFHVFFAISTDFPPSSKKGFFCSVVQCLEYHHDYLSSQANILLIRNHLPDQYNPKLLPADKQTTSLLAYCSTETLVVDILNLL
ncbi:hypothetical protein BO99DRAFT_451948 [Aspergillus violaceofuscus CBS 115571]|uniref:Uncharacterized protein n=1 Tax=Aspergillus violaceofuscus (strain CBS 115571) TaxID=1450538 RepID=A0A2V5GRF0_ASPV1|nr:hypothetical protein BO99DRAFT_451948 [Aspergillus violaceofuscus CBS 115571]